MRTYRLILSLLLAAPLCINVAAQELHDKAWSVLNEGGALWMGSENAAGLSFDAPAEFNLLDADFSLFDAGRLVRDSSRAGGTFLGGVALGPFTHQIAGFEQCVGV